MGIKENFAQAVRELTGFGDDKSESKSEKKSENKPENKTATEITAKAEITENEKSDVKVKTDREQTETSFAPEPLFNDAQADSEILPLFSPSENSGVNDALRQSIMDEDDDMNMGGYTAEFEPVSEPVTYAGAREEHPRQRKSGLDVYLNEVNAHTTANDARQNGGVPSDDERLHSNPAVYPEIPAGAKIQNDTFWEVTSAPPLPDLAGAIEDSFGFESGNPSVMFGNDFSSEVAATSAGYGLNLGQEIPNLNAAKRPSAQQQPPRTQRVLPQQRPVINSAEPRRQNPVIAGTRVPVKQPNTPKNYGGGNIPPRGGNTNYGQNQGYGSDELTVISKNTVIDGNIRSFANMNIEGDVKGDVETTKNVDLNGKVVGNLTCNNAEMHISQVQGNIHMKGNVEMDRDTLLIGDLVSSYARLNGKIKGNIEINGKAELREDAVVFGDISASTLTVEDGAIIQGFVSTTFLNKEESRNIFPEQVKIGEL